ncbi:MAG: AAA family ATPase [Bacilli bacterium]
MIIKKLVVNNFRQFKGENILEFSTDKDKNMTIVYGQNTTGKTTLLQMFFWVLYNKITLQNSADILNIELKNEMKVEDERAVSVDIYIEHNKLNYRFSRRINFKKITNGEIKNLGHTEEVAYKFNSKCDMWERQDDKYYFETQVKKMLPEKLSQFFFFDGERVDSISKEQKNSSKEIGKNIKKIVGLENLENTIRIIGSASNSRTVLGKLNKKIELQKTDAVDDIKTNIYKNQKEINDCRKEIERLTEDNIKSEEYCEVVKEKLKNNEEAEATFKDIDNIEKQKNEKEDNLNNIKNEYKKNIKKGIEAIYLKTIEKEVLDLIKQYEETEDGVPEMHATSIDYLLKHKKCICGLEFKHDDVTYNNLLKERRKLPPESLGVTINTFKNVLSVKNVFDQQQKYTEDEKKKYTKYQTIMRDISNCEALIKSKRDAVATYKDCKDDSKKLSDIERDIGKNNEKIEQADAKILILNEEYKDLQDKLSEFELSSIQNKKTNKYIGFTKEILNQLNELSTKKEKEIIAKLEKEMNNSLRQMYDGERKIEISDDYEIKLKYLDDIDGEKESSESEGLGIMKAIAFIEALLKIATKKIMLKNCDDDNDDEYPLVLDAPFSKLDDVHIKKTITTLPETARQVIIFTMDKDMLKYKEDQNNKIGVEYKLGKINECVTEIKEVKRNV